MRKILLILVTLPFILNAQTDLRASMGINFVNMPDFRDYLNENYGFQGENLADFSSMIEFSAEITEKISNKFYTGVELSYSFNSFTTVLYGGKYEMKYSFVQPTAVIYHVTKGKGYAYRIGGGIGPRFVSLSETKPYSIYALNYTSTGYGLVFRGDASTQLSQILYAYIGADLRYEAGGTPKSDGVAIIHRNKNVEISAFSAGIKLGLFLQL